jgi:ABC-2 type transport system ATP-binding protein
LIGEGGSGPATATPDDTGLVSTASLSITPARATNAVNVSIPAPAAEAIALGAPSLTITYSGTVEPGERPMAVFAQLIDESTGLVLGNQVTPIAVILNGASHTDTIDLEMIAHTVAPGSTITLQLVATTVTYAQPRLGGVITFGSINVSLPTITNATLAD